MPLVGTKANAGAFGLGWSSGPAGEASGGMVLMTPTSVASTGTGSTATIGSNGSVTFSSCVTLSLNGVFTSSYENYIVVCRIKMTSASGNNISWRLRANGTDNTTASSYTDQYFYVDGSSILGARGSADNGDFTYSYAGLEMGFMANIYGPNIANPTPWRTACVSDLSSALLYDYCGTHNQSTAYDGFSLSSYSVSNRPISGLISVYGLVGA